MLNTTRIKLQVERAIKALPSNVELKRLDKVSDGLGGFIKNNTPSLVATFEAFIDTSSSSLSITLKDAATIKTEKQISLLAVYSSDFEIKEGDFFMLNSKKYKVTSASSQYEIYWECTLEVEKC
jgi:hypothetical protein